ncbi:MAG: metal ABC transporter permease [Candidatus Eisenbacteria bacterium]
MESVYAWLAALAKSAHLPQAFQYPFMLRGMIAGLIVAPLLGGMSHLVVARRLAFFSTALGHAALTGVSLGLLLGEPISGPYAGIFGICLLSGLAMVYVKRRAALPPDTLIGVFLALTLGLGICLLVAVTKRFNIHQIEAVMFGSLLTVSDLDLALLLVGGAIVAVVLARPYNDLYQDSLSPNLAEARGIDTMRTEYVFVLTLTLAIVLSLKIVGALLVEALVVVPAAAARNLARSTRSYIVWSVLIATVSAELGLFVSARWRVPSGGAIVLVLSALFFVTLGLGRGLSRRD